ncbi:MAG: hypothetical protein JW959_03725 [Pirellulales bacterium]|nr:hypothetical protein [Pirellulales bacterium]
MNLVGKIFVVLIFVMSLVFMSFAMAVYTVQQNWREVVELPADKVVPGKQKGLKYQLQDADARIKELNDRWEQAQKDRKTETVNKQKALTALETERDELLTTRRELEALLAGEEKAKREAVAAMTATQKLADGYRKELEQLRKDYIEAERDRDAHFNEVTRKTDELHQAANELQQLKLRLAELSKDLAKYKELARWLDAPDPDSDYKSKIPPRVDGLVTATPGKGLVEISIGADDGLSKGHRLEVYRVSGDSSVYVGRIEVVETAPAKSVCKIDPKFQNSQVREGDRVVSKLD